MAQKDRFLTTITHEISPGEETTQPSAVVPAPANT